MRSAANVIDATFTDPVTVNLAIGHGELTAGSTTYPLTGGAAEAEAFGGGAFSYSQVRGLLVGEASADVLGAVQALPDAAAVQGQSSLVVGRRSERRSASRPPAARETPRCGPSTPPRAPPAAAGGWWSRSTTSRPPACNTPAA